MRSQTAATQPQDATVQSQDPKAESEDAWCAVDDFKRAVSRAGTQLKATAWRIHGGACNRPAAICMTDEAWRKRRESVRVPHGSTFRISDSGFKTKASALETLKERLRVQKSERPMADFARHKRIARRALRQRVPSRVVETLSTCKSANVHDPLLHNVPIYIQSVHQTSR